MARTKSSACSAMRISKTACRKKQDDRLQSGDGRFYTFGIIIRFAIMKSSADTAVCHGFGPQQRVSGSAVPAACRRRRDWLPMGRPGIAAVWRRRCRCSPAGYAVPTARGKRGQGHRMVPLPPLDSPKPSFAPRLPSVARRNGGNGGNGGSVPCVGQILGRCQTLNLLCVNRRA